MQTYLDKVAIFQQFIHLQQYRSSLPIFPPVLPPHLSTLFQLSQQTIKSQYDKSTKRPNLKQKLYPHLEQRFLSAYQTLTPLQKLDMYIRQMKCVKDIFSGNYQEDNTVPDVIEESQAYTLSYSLHIWRKKVLKLKHYQGILQISREGRVKEFDLRNYVIRESKNSEYNCFVLESINSKVTEKNRVVRVGFKGLGVFQEWFLRVKGCVIRMERERLREEVGEYEGWEVNHRVEKKGKQDGTPKKNEKQKEYQKQEQEKCLTSSPPRHSPIPKHPFPQTPNPNPNLESSSSGSDMTVKTVVQTLLDNSQLSSILQILSPSLTHSPSKKHLNLFSLILPQYRLDSLPQTYFHELIHQQKDMRIYRNNDIPQKYKVIIPTKETELENVVKVIFNVEGYKKWNPSVEQANIKSIISSQNMVIIYQKHKQYSSIYRSRDYVYLRHVFSKDNNLYIVDKSIIHAQYPPSMLIVRGSIGCLWGVMKGENGEYTVIVDVMVQNEGLISGGQDHNVTMIYLKGLLGLQGKVRGSRGEKGWVEVFDLGWDIDNVVKEKVKGGKVTKSVPTTPFKQISSTVSDKEEERIAKTGYEKKRRETIQQQKQKSLIIEPRKRNLTSHSISQKSQNIIQQIERSTIKTKTMQDSAIAVKIPITSITYQFDFNGQVIIPQEFIFNKYYLTPTGPKQPLLQQVINGHAIWKGEWKFDKAGGMIFINQTKLDHQKGVLKYVLGKIAKNLLSGKSILHISLPVDIFAPETNLERFAFSMSYAPLILEKAFKQKTAIQKFKNVIAYGITNSVLYLNMEKPFNPILGQTFQGWINGCPIYLQQISHHPPIASFLFLGRGYKITGSLQSKVELQMNSGCGITDGVYRIVTDDGADFNFITPGGQISGLTFGDRKFNLVGKCNNVINTDYVWSKRYQLFVQIKLDPTNKGFFSKRNQPSDYMQGNIFQVTRQFIQDFELMKKKDKPSKDHIIHDLGKASGIWSKILLFDGQTYLDLDKDVGCKLEYDGHLLPSDGNWREDVAYRTLNDNVKAQSQKERLENVQRNDRKLREKMGGGGKH